MRILHVSEAHMTGVLTLLQHFATQQSAQGHDVHLLAPGAMPPIAGASQHTWGVSRRDPRTYAAAVRELRRVVARVEPDVVHLHSFIAGVVGRLPVAGLDRRRTPLVYQPHSWAFDLFSGSKRATVERWERSAARRTSVLVANCQDEVAEGRRAGVSTPAHVLGVATDLKHFRPPTAEERARARAALAGTDGHLVLVPGRLAFQKGQDLLVPAWERRPLPDTTLVLVGPGDGSRLAQQAPTTWGGSVRHAGPTDDMRSWLWAADLVVLPSRYEGFPLVVAEALACGVPVVATRFNGAAEIIEAAGREAVGETVPLDDMDALLDACEQELGAAAGSGRRRRARERALELFEPAQVHDALMHAYDTARRATPGDVR